MTRSLLLARAALLALGLAGLAALSGPTSGQEPKVKPFVEPERAFRLGDADKDGKLTKDEFAKLLANNPRIKENPKAGDLLFARLDADGDGKLTADEFKRIAELGPGPGKGKGFPPKKDFRKKDEPR